MDNDSIRSSGSGNTLVEIWIDGKLRGITISRTAIEGFLNLSPDQAKAMSADDRCEFVRSNLPLIMNAVRARLQETGADSDAVLIEEGQFGGARASAPRAGGDRRTTERRKGADRRKPEPPGPRKEGDRRHGDRRKTNRRAPTRRS